MGTEASVRFRTALIVIDNPLYWPNKSANEVPSAIRQAGEQLARKNKSTGSSVDIANLFPNLEMQCHTI